MQLLRSLKIYPQFANGVVATIGNFDGVHLGHQHLLRDLRAQADFMQLPLVVVLFEPQPREFFMELNAPPRITPLRDKFAALKKCKVDYVLCLRFNHGLANMQAHDFAEKIIFNCLNAKYLLVGRDFKFGYARLGNFALLENLSKIHGCAVHQFSDFGPAKQRISSTIIRKLLANANFSQVETLLGRKYSISGRVIRGDKNARKWGFPTANINIAQLPLVLKGVYCVQIRRKRGNILHGVANIGRRPTITNNRQLLEVHIFGFDASLYGEELEVLFIDKIRDEKKFASIDDLVTQISQDIELAEKYFLQQQRKSKAND